MHGIGPAVCARPSGARGGLRRRRRAGSALLGGRCRPRARSFCGGCGVCATGTRTVVRRVSPVACAGAHPCNQHRKVPRGILSFSARERWRRSGTHCARPSGEATLVSRETKPSQSMRFARGMTRHRCRWSRNGSSRPGRWRQLRTAENSAAASAGRRVSSHCPRRDRWRTDCREEGSTAPPKNVTKEYRGSGRR